MGDGLNTDENKCVTMGATSNPNSARLAVLQERKKTLEETITKRNQELRELCLKEAELTGITPPEIPAEIPGEPTPPSIPKVGARYQLPQNLLTNINNEDESLEIQIQLHYNMAEAAKRLYNDNTLTKTIRKQHHEHYKQQLELCMQKRREQESQLQAQAQLKPKKKQRAPEHEDAVSVNITTNMHEHNFGKSALRHSMRSLQHPIKSNDTQDHRFSSQPKLTYRKSDDNLYIENAHMKHEDMLLTFPKLNLNNKYDHHDGSESSLHNYPQYPSNTSPHGYVPYSYPKTSSMMHQGSPQLPSPSSSSYHPDYHYKTTPPQIHRSMMPNTVQKSQKLNYPQYPSSQYSYSSSYGMDHVPYNPLQIQPHQQYEHDVMPTGLGGYWKQKENGDLIWCHNSNFENVWQRDKRCGSLDRRKNKRLHKRISPNVDPKSATLASVPMHAEISRQAMIPIPQVAFRNRQENCQLVRTQSLGSVGVHTIDNVYPSDDNSSCGSETYSYDTNTITRKQKQKEWYETSLDDVPLPSTPKTPRSLSTIPPILPDVKYTEVPHVPYISPPPPQKQILEIPAESKPSPKIADTSMELFNNNIPKNCTVVLAGHCKPYHEETKPFEMSDFYKYSTKFKNAPGKSQETDKNLNSFKVNSPVNSQSYLDDNHKSSLPHKGIYQPLQPMKCQPYNPLSNPNVGHPMTPMVNINQDIGSPVIDHYPHMNNWYRSEDQPDSGGGERSRSTATLV